MVGPDIETRGQVRQCMSEFVNVGILLSYFRCNAAGYGLGANGHAIGGFNPMSDYIMPTG